MPREGGCLLPAGEGLQEESGGAEAQARAAMVTSKVDVNVELGSWGLVITAFETVNCQHLTFE